MSRRILLKQQGALFSWEVLSRNSPRGRWKETSHGSVTWTGISKASVIAWLCDAFGVKPADIVEVANGG